MLKASPPPNKISKINEITLNFFLNQTISFGAPSLITGAHCFCHTCPSADSTWSAERMSWMNSTTCWRPITDKWPNGKLTLWRQRRSHDMTWHDMLLNSFIKLFLYSSIIFFKSRQCTWLLIHFLFVPVSSGTDTCVVMGPQTRRCIRISTRTWVYGGMTKRSTSKLCSNNVTWR